jgi:hypothetical protein
LAFTNIVTVKLAVNAIRTPDSLGSEDTSGILDGIKHITRGKGVAARKTTSNLALRKALLAPRDSSFASGLELRCAASGSGIQMMRVPRRNLRVIEKLRMS